MGRFRIGNKIIDLSGALTSSFSPLSSSYVLKKEDILNVFNISNESDIVNEIITQQKILNAIGFSTFGEFVNQNISKSFLNLNNVENKSSSDIRSEITIEEDGKLSGIGTDGIIVSNEKVDAEHIRQKINVASLDDIKNSNVTKISVGLSNVANESPNTIRSGITIDTMTGKLLGIGTANVVVSNDKVDAEHIRVKINVQSLDDIKNSNVTKSSVGLGSVENKSSSDIRNEITIDQDGKLSGIGTSDIIVSNEKVDAEHIRQKINVASLDDIKNSNVTKSSVGLGSVENKSSSDIRSEITIDQDGKLSGIGTNDVVVSNDKVDAEHIRVKINVDSLDDIKNSNVTKHSVGLGSVENKSSNDIRSEITIGEDGSLTGIGTSGVVVSNDKVDAVHIVSKIGVSSVEELKNANVDAAHIASKVGVDSVDHLKNSNISISKNLNNITLHNGITTHTAAIEKNDIGLGNVADLDLTAVHTNFNEHTPTTIIGGVTLDTETPGVVKLKRTGHVDHSFGKSHVGLGNVEDKSSVDIRNEITIGEDGTLAGIGTIGITVSNEKVDAAHIASKVGVESVNQLKNSNISISKDANTITLNNGVTTHAATIEKSDIGLGSVENKSSGDIRSEITIGEDGALSGIGTSGVVVSNDKVDATHIATQVGVTSVEELKNTNISISKDANSITLNNGVTTHVATIEKSDIGLGNVENKSSNDIRSEITIDQDGKLSGIGTVDVVVSNDKVDAEHIRIKINVDSLEEIKNSNVTKDSVGLGFVENKSSNDIRSEITIDADGKLSGIGTIDVVVSNDKVDAAHIATQVGVTSVDELKNSNISISKDANNITLNNGVTTHTATIEKTDIGLGSVANLDLTNVHTNFNSQTPSSIRSAITIDTNGIIQGIGTAGKTVSNDKITIDSTTGVLTGVGTAGVVVSNSKVTIDANGIIQGIGTTGKVVSNDKITLTATTGTVELDTGYSKQSITKTHLNLGSVANLDLTNVHTNFNSQTPSSIRSAITVDATTGKLMGIGTADVIVSNEKVDAAHIATKVGVQSVNDIKNSQVSYSIIKNKTLLDQGTTDKSSNEFNAFVVDYDDIGGFDYAFQIPVTRALFTGTRTINGTSGVSAKIVVSGSKNTRLNTSDHLYNLSLVSIGTGSGNTYLDSSLFIKQESSTKPAILIESYTSNPYNWSLMYTTGADLGFFNTGVQRAYIRNDIVVDDLNFTGQHRTITSDINLFEVNSTGLIVVSKGAYDSTSNVQNPHENITINESLPIVELSSRRNQKSVFGVISNKEDENPNRVYSLGNFSSVFEKKHENDRRLIINSIGEGAIWVSDINGELENGDYITSCEIPGYGMRQDDDVLHSYTVAKITCDCSFDLSSEIYRCEEFEWEGQTYRRAFVGCTYHCG